MLDEGGKYRRKPKKRSPGLRDDFSSVSWVVYQTYLVLLTRHGLRWQCPVEPQSICLFE
ncbi:MAG: hypothetical protein SWY16_14525 [Cyanobacteriota bacterium]|nr:hypothetical protein [Cyanobacteriota bacterium]